MVVGVAGMVVVVVEVEVAEGLVVATAVELGAAGAVDVDPPPHAARAIRAVTRDRRKGVA